MVGVNQREATIRSGALENRQTSRATVILKSGGSFAASWVVPRTCVPSYGALFIFSGAVLFAINKGGIL